MVQRCDLCGARLRAEEQACRECGTAHPPLAGAAESDPFAANPVAGTDVTRPPTDPIAPIPVIPGPATTSPGVLSPPVPAAVSAAPHPIGDAPSSFGDAPHPIADAPVEFGFGGEAAQSGGFTDARRSRAGLWAALGLVGVGGAVAAVLGFGGDDATPASPTEVADDRDSVAASPSTPAAAKGCDALAALAGSWNVVSEVTDAASAKKLDIRGFYRLEIDVTDCVARATLSKTGFTGQTFADRHIQQGTSVLEPGTGAFAFSFGARFALRDTRGKGLDQEFFFASRSGDLVGAWRQRGRAWERSALSGVLVGARDTTSDELVPRVANLPCAGRCLFSCDALASTASADDLGACIAACDESSETIAACGGRVPAATDLALSLVGPQPTLAGLCPGGACDVDPKLDRRRTPRVTGNPGPIHEARFVYVAQAPDAPANMRLALQTNAGWYLSAALSQDPIANPAKEISTVRIAATAVGSGAPPGVVTGHYSRRGKVLVFACTSRADAPNCIIVRGLDRAREVAIVPGATLALRRSDGSALQAW